MTVPAIVPAGSGDPGRLAPPLDSRRSAGSAPPTPRSATGRLRVPPASGSQRAVRRASAPNGARAGAARSWREGTAARAKPAGRQRPAFLTSVVSAVCAPHGSSSALALNRPGRVPHFPARPPPSPSAPVLGALKDPGAMCSSRSESIAVILQKDTRSPTQCAAERTPCSMFDSFKRAICTVGWGLS